MHTLLSWLTPFIMPCHTTGCPPPPTSPNVPYFCIIRVLNHTLLNCCLPGAALSITDNLKSEKNKLETKVDHESYRARGPPAKTRYSGHLNSPPNLKVAKKRPQVRFSYYMKEHRKVQSAESEKESDQMAKVKS